jgi:hypothetical protein
VDSADLILKKKQNGKKSSIWLKKRSVICSSEKSKGTNHKKERKKT